MSRRRQPGPAGLVLAPGASAGPDQPALVAIDAAVSGAGLAVERVEFPYRAAGRRRPDAAPVLMATVRRAAEELAGRIGVSTARIALGGRSMGGRMASMAAAEGLAAAALVLVSYPLHPPGRPDRLRVDHFAALDLPCLFVSGTRDAFGAPVELEREVASIPGPVTLSFLDGGDHSLRRRDAELATLVRDWLLGLPG
ncbi:MAG TPA: alpha/beta family hydrolase [Acidimicrobiales bacterium]|nr:alpha/beta family hydrolase [Acidimicrobiales bacterium]